jgi:hypothetical protein
MMFYLLVLYGKLHRIFMKNKKRGIDNVVLMDTDEVIMKVFHRYWREVCRQQGVVITGRREISSPVCYYL